MYGLGDVRRDLFSSKGRRPPSRCLLCERFRVGRFIWEGVVKSAIEYAELGVEGVEEAEPRDCHCSRTIEFLASVLTSG